MRHNLNKITSEEEWATPIELYESLDKEFHFNLDPCATDENHKCEKYFTKADDGLSQDWGGVQSVLQSTIWQEDKGLDQESL